MLDKWTVSMSVVGRCVLLWFVVDKMVDAAKLDKA